MDLNLDMSRGKPSVEQLDLSMGLMDVLSSDSDLACEDGTDCRNYGVIAGVQEAKVLLGDMMENNPDNIIIFGNSSLRKLLSERHVRYSCKSNDSRRYGKYSLGKTGQGEIPVPGSRI